LPAILTIHSNEIPALQSPVTEKVEACAVSVRKTMQDPTAKGKKLMGWLTGQQYWSPEVFEGIFPHRGEILCLCFHQVESRLLKHLIQFLLKTVRTCCGDMSE